MNKKFSVAIINYNMAETLEESLRSILDQLDERFEVLVVDDGSTDGSQEILDRLKEEYEILRWIEGDNNNRGEARAQSVELSKGDLILWGLDCDDYYKQHITEFTDFYEELEQKTRKYVHLKGHGIKIAPKNLLLEKNFRSLHRKEDEDILRRHLVSWDTDLVIINNNKIYNEIGSVEGKFKDKTGKERVYLNYINMKCRLRAGLSSTTLIKYNLRKLRQEKIVDYLFNLGLFIPAYLQAKTVGILGLGGTVEDIIDIFELREAKSGEEIADIYNLDKEIIEKSEVL